MVSILNLLHMQVPLWLLLLSTGLVLIVNHYIFNNNTKIIEEKVINNNNNNNSSSNSSNSNNSNNSKKSKSNDKSNSNTVTVPDDDEDDIDDESHQAYLNTIKNNYSLDSYKMVLCVNMELKMDKGKIAAQCGHATLGAYKMALKHCPSAVTWWTRTGQAKIAVKVEKESLIYEIEKKAKQAGLVTYLVEDAGRTQIAAGSRTVLAIGPAPTKSFEGLTSDLKLL